MRAQQHAFFIFTVNWFRYVFLINSISLVVVDNAIAVKIPVKEKTNKYISTTNEFALNIISKIKPVKTIEKKKIRYIIIPVTLLVKDKVFSLLLSSLLEYCILLLFEGVSKGNKYFY